MTMLALILASWLASANAGYTLKSQYDATNFFDPSSFSFYNGYDQFTDGFALYQPIDQALSQGLANYTEGQVYLGADWEQKLSSTTVGQGHGRSSVRLEGTSTFDNGLFIGDFDHLPSGACGQWPAFWLLHDDDDGYSEIDIVESVSLQDQNSVTLYSSPQACTMNDNGGSGTTRGTQRPLDCSLDSGGCGADAAPGTFGDSFNNKGGGFWATQVESDGIKVWYFPHGGAPADINGPNPDPTKWGTPMMNYGPKNCNMKQAFRKMKIIINITFCGPYAGQDSWGGFTGCQASTGVKTCEKYVANNPNAFINTFFLINSVKVFQKPQVTSSSSGSAQKPTSSTLIKATSSTKMVSTTKAQSSPTPAPSSNKSTPRASTSTSRPRPKY